MQTDASSSAFTIIYLIAVLVTNSSIICKQLYTNDYRMKDKYKLPMTTNIESDPTTKKLDGNIQVVSATPSLAAATTVTVPLSPSTPAKPRTTPMPAAPLKKRALRLPHQRLKMKRHMLKHQGSSSLQTKHRSYTSVNHLERVKFSLFLKILMHYLSMKDEDFAEQARAVALDCINSQREGKLQDTPLISALKGRLFGLIGKNDWEICERYLQRYLTFHNIVTEL